MKTDAEIELAITRAHTNEERCAVYLRGQGLWVRVLSKGFRASAEQIVDYAHDIDFDIGPGAAYQLKYREILLAGLWRAGWQPFVDERAKADRTPVDGYILRFGDACVVAPYNPEAWDVEVHEDVADRSTKEFYTVGWERVVGLDVWVQQMRRTYATGR